MIEYIEANWSTTYALMLLAVAAFISWASYRRGYWKGYDSGYTDGVNKAKGWGNGSLR